VRLWDVASGQCIRVIEGGFSEEEMMLEVTGIAWHFDGRRFLVFEEQSYGVKIWDAETGILDCSLQGDDYMQYAIGVWSPDGRNVLVTSHCSSLQLWNTETRTSECIIESDSEDYAISCMAWCTRSGRVLLGCTDGTIALWDIESRRRLRTMQKHKGAISGIKWFSDGKHAVSASEDGTIRLWDTDRGRCLRVINNFRKAVPILDAPVSGCTLDETQLTGLEEEDDANSDDELMPFTAVAVSSDGRRILSGSSDGAVHLWDASSGESLCVFGDYGKAPTCVAWSTDARQIVTGAADGSVRLWDVGTGEELQTFEQHSKAVVCVALSPDGKVIASGAALGDGRVLVWDVSSGRCLRMLHGEAIWTNSVVWSPDGRFLATLLKSPSLSSDDLFIRVWDVETWECVRLFEGDFWKLVSWGQNGLLAVFKSLLFKVDAKTSAQQPLLDIGAGITCIHSGSSVTVPFAKHGSHAVLASMDHKLHFFNLESGQCVRTLEGGRDLFMAVALRADGRFLISGSSSYHEHIVRLWDVKTGSAAWSLECHMKSIISVGWSADGKLAYSIAENGVMRTWDIDRAARFLA
jgi:WD40 repeat protein